MRSLTVNPVQRQLNKIFAFFTSVLNVRIFLAIVFLSLVTGVQAQDVTMPTVEIDGIDEDTTGENIIIIILKFIARLAIWAIMVGAGYVALKNIVKAWNAQRNNDEARWGVVIGDVIGNAVMVILVIALGTWILGFLA